MRDERRIAYFSMEIGFETDVPTYAGGLGILAGDTIRSAADCGVPMVAVTLLHRRGYFSQRLDAEGWQIEEPGTWPVDRYMADTGARIQVEIERRTVALRIWRYDVQGENQHVVPIYLLDADLPENADWDRTLTDVLYGGDERYRLCQEVVLGIGGIRALRVLGHDGLKRYHMNEGHAALLVLELLRERREAEGRSEISLDDLDGVRRHCVFTTHTPVPAGHDQFDLKLVERVLGDRKACGISDSICHANRLNMTYLALSLSQYVNGVAKRHADLSQHLFAGYKIDAITNGVHAPTWVSPPLADLFDHRIPGWRQDNFSLRYALSLSNDEVWAAHRQAKMVLLDRIERDLGTRLEADVLTFGFARRATAYKRGDLIFEDMEPLLDIARQVGRLQLVFAGKAHPRDEEGKRLIQKIVRVARTHWREIPIVYLPNYDMRLAGLMVSGVDVWLNTPQAPMEASGTSGMKAAMNGVPSLSVLDGWWLEGCIEGVTGWSIFSSAPDLDAAALHAALRNDVVPLYYRQRDRFIDVMRHAVALNGSFFNTQRMVQQYVLKAYF